MDIDQEVHTVEETASILRVGKNTVYAAVRKGEIPSIRIGDRILVPRIALQRMLNGEAV